MRRLGSAKGVYRFLSNKAVTRQALLVPHRRNTVERCRAVKEVVVIHDTMYWSLTHHPATEGLGPIRTAGGLERVGGPPVSGRGVGPGEVLGLLEQEVWARQGRKAKDETSRERRLRDRESQCWSREMKGASRGLTNIIHVADRESDIYEVLEWLISEGQRYVIRASKNRRLAGKEANYLFKVHWSPVVGKMTVTVGPRPVGGLGRHSYVAAGR